MKEASASIVREIEAIQNTEVLVETNEGTFGFGLDPRWKTRNVYQTVSGAKRSTGPDEDDAPGYMRRMGQREMQDLRARLADLEKDYRRVNKF